MKNVEAALVLSRIRNALSPSEREALHLAILALKHQPSLADGIQISRGSIADRPLIRHVAIEDNGRWQVMNGHRCVCIAESGNYAKRIANALNRYQPNRKGQ